MKKTRNLFFKYLGSLSILTLGLVGLESKNASALTSAELATQVQKTYEATHNLEMDFEQETYVALLEKKVLKQGKITLKKPGKFRILYEGKRGRHYYSDAKTLWIIQEGDHQVQTVPLNDDNVPAEALSFLTGLGNLKQEFATEEVDPKKWEAFNREKGRLAWLELTPLKKLSHIQWLIMGFDPETFLAQELYLLNEGGNLTHYRFKNIQKPAQLADELFLFKQIP